MIRFERVAEPSTFDARVRRRGQAWLKENQSPAEPPRLWTDYLSHLADGFLNLCAYSVMHIEDGTVDHYRSCKNFRELAYEWDNYRYASFTLNSAKGNADDRVLDPFDVGEDWFEIRLPDLQLMPTAKIPPEYRERAHFTLKRLGLRDGEKIIRRRRAWYEQFLNGRHSLDGLRHYAPLVAKAVERRLSRTHLNVLDEEQVAYQRFLDSELTLRGLRTIAPRVAQAVDIALAK